MHIAQLKVAVAMTLANTKSSQNAVPGRPISIKIDKDDELGYGVDYSFKFRVELFFIFLRVLHGWGIDIN